MKKKNSSAECMPNRSQDGTGAGPSIKCLHSGGHVTKQGFEACAVVGATMVTLTGRSVAWGNLGKGSDRIKA